MPMFFVKTVYRTRPVGRPVAVDRRFDPKFSIVEERIVMFSATDADDACSQAEREARVYEQYTYENPYGQTVETTYLGALSAYELYGPLEAGAEVYSSTEVISTDVSDGAAVDLRMGHEESVAEVARRVNVADGDILVLRPARAAAAETGTKAPRRAKARVKAKPSRARRSGRSR